LTSDVEIKGKEINVKIKKTAESSAGETLPQRYRPHEKDYFRRGRISPRRILPEKNMKNIFKKTLKFVSSRLTYLIIGIFIAIGAT